MADKFNPKPSDLLPMTTLLSMAIVDEIDMEEAIVDWESDPVDPAYKTILRADTVDS